MVICIPIDGTINKVSFLVEVRRHLQYSIKTKAHTRKYIKLLTIIHNNKVTHKSNKLIKTFTGSSLCKINFVTP